MYQIEVVYGDITQLEVDAVVTAANSALCGGGGVDGAVHGAAGPQLVEMSRTMAPCPTGEAKITPAFNMRPPIEHVIHAVGPVWHGGDANEELNLECVYLYSLSIADDCSIETIAFPCISTGVYGFPQELACNIATETVVKRSLSNEIKFPKKVIFCCFEISDYELYKSRLEELGV